MGNVISRGGGETKGQAGACEQVRSIDIYFRRFTLWLTCTHSCAGGYGERRRNSRAQQRRKGYDTNWALGTSRHVFWGLASINLFMLRT